VLSVAERALGLSGKELRRAFPIFLYLFLATASSVASKAARDALFLDRYRAIDLPYVDIAIAVLVGIAAAFYIRIGEKTNLRNLQVGSLIFFAANALFFWLWAALASYESGLLFIVIYVWVGVFAVLAPLATAIAVVVFVGTIAATRFISAGSIAGALALPVAGAVGNVPNAVETGALLAAALVIIRHRDNVSRLLAGTERRIGLRL